MEARLDVFEAWVEDPSLVTDLGLIDQHKKRTINCWRSAPYSERDAAFLMRCMHQAQHDIVLMMDSVYLRSAEALDKVLKRVLAALLACLEGLLEFIERHRPLYFNMGQKVPDCIRVRKGLEQGTELPEGCTYVQLDQLRQEKTGKPVEILEGDLTEEMTAKERAEYDRYAKTWGDYVMETGLKVEEFGAFLRTLVDLEAYKIPDREEKRFWMFQGYHTRTDRTRRTSWLNLRNSSVSQKTEVWQQVKKLGLQIARLAQERIMLGMK